jgi:hypothetical protein
LVRPAKILPEAIVLTWRVGPIEELLQSTDYRGFPVVRNEQDKTILGFIRKSELRYALGKIKTSDV